MGIIKASARVATDLDVAFEAAFKLVVGDVDALLLETAQDVGFNARRSAAFEDYKGTARETKYSKKHRSKNAKKLRDSIKLEKSEFKDGGYIVTARAPHAHLVEFGHLEVIKNKKGIVKVVGHVAPHPFLRPACDAARNKLIAKIQAMNGAANG